MWPITTPSNSKAVLFNRSDMQHIVNNEKSYCIQGQKK